MFLYLLISCTIFSAACGLERPVVEKAPFVAGISLILFSDTLISLTEFRNYHLLNALILPTYYGALIAITFSLIVRSDRYSARRNGESS